MKKELVKEMSENSAHLITMNVGLYKKINDKLIKPFEKEKIDKIVSPEAKGFFYGPVIALKKNLPFCPIFKGNRKIPKEFLYSENYIDYSGDKKSLEIGKMQIKKGGRILIIDDVLETGESAKAVIRLIEKAGGEIIGISVIYNKLKKRDENFFNKYNFKYITK